MEYYEKNARLKCVKCRHKWVQRSGPTTCPIETCQNLYIVWKNHPLNINGRNEK